MIEGLKERSIEFALDPQRNPTAVITTAPDNLIAISLFNAGLRPYLVAVAESLELPIDEDTMIIVEKMCLEEAYLSNNTINPTFQTHIYECDWYEGTYSVVLLSTNDAVEE